VREETLQDIERWWRSQLAVGDELWTTTTVQRRGEQGEDNQGWFIAWRQGGVHVVMPPAVEIEQVSPLRSASVAELQRAEFWRAFARQLGVTLLGPNVYLYLDEAPARLPGFVRLRRRSCSTYARASSLPIDSSDAIRTSSY